MTMKYEWYCEECGEKQEVKPSAIQRVPGKEGWIELWFCEGCAA